MNIDEDGYLVSLDELDTRPIGVNGEVRFDGTMPGDHTVTLRGLAPNCRVPVSGFLSDEGMSQTKPVDISVPTRFQVTCWATGTIRIQTTSTGANVPGLLLGIVTNHPLSIIELPANGTHDVKFVTARLHRVTVGGCGSQVVANPTVRADEVVTVKASFACP